MKKNFKIKGDRLYEGLPREYRKSNLKAEDEYFDDEQENDGLVGHTEVIATADKIFINILGDITHELYDALTPTLLEIVASKNTNDIVIFIDSCGGLMEPTMDIVRLIKAMDNKVITVAFNNCSSSACLLFSLGDERYFLSGTEYIMHKVKASLLDPNTWMQDEGFMELAKSLKEREEEYKKVILEGSDIPNSKLSDVFGSKEDTKFTEEEILKYNIATKIIMKFSEIEM